VSDLGVVDPIRVPAPVLDLAARFRGLPMVARLFIALTALDAAARTMGVIEPGVGGDLVGLFASYVPRDALILLPAVVLARRPTAATDTPWLLRASIFLALVELLTRPTLSIIGNLLPPDAVDPNVAFAIVESGLRGAAYAVLGIGLMTLNPKSPRPVSAGLGNLTGIGVLVAFVAFLVGSLAVNSRFDPLGDPLPVWSYVAPFFGGLGLAYLLRAVARGLDDPSRSERATRIATSGALIWTFGLLAEAIFGVIGIFVHVFLPADVTNGLGLLEAIGPLILVMAFVVGLGDPLRPMPKAWEAAAAG
jgi:hypothetical protein